MRSKTRTHITVHVRGPFNEPVAEIVRIADIESVRPIDRRFDNAEKIPEQFVTYVRVKDRHFSHDVTETVDEVQALLDFDPNTDALKRIERTLVEILGQMKRS